MDAQFTENSDHKIEESIKKCIQDLSITPKYQNRLTIFFALVALVTTMQLYSSGLFYMNPVFQCEGDQSKIFEDDACSRLQYCDLINTETITAQLEIYCGSKKYLRTMLQASGGIGSWLGLIFVAFSDRLGKKFTFCSCLLLLNLTWILQFIGTYTNSIEILIVSEVICGFCHKGILITFLVLLTRFLRKQDYEWGTIIWFTAYHGLSQIAIASLNAIFLDWRAIVYVYAMGIAFCSVIALFILKEDPVFLFEVGWIVEAKRILEDVGRQNGLADISIKQVTDRIDLLFQTKMRRVQQLPHSVHKFNLRQIVRCDILQKVLIIGAAGCFFYSACRSIDLSIQSLEYSYNFNLFIIGYSNIVGFISSIYIIRIESKRKRGLIYTSLIYGVLALLFLFPFCNQNGNVETLVIICLRVLLCWSCNFFTRLKVDSFPEKYQMVIISFLEFFTNFGFVITPTIVQKSIDKNINPIISIDILRIIIGTIPVFFLVEGRVNLISNQIPKIDNGDVSIDEKHNPIHYETDFC